MSRRPQTAVFLQKASYRQRRVRDAARLLPALGAVLLMIPLAWQDAPLNSNALLYVFGVWFGLIGVTALLQSRIRKDHTAPEEDRSTP